MSRERTVRDRRRRVVVIARELMAMDGQGAGLWCLTADGRDLCNHAWHESIDEAWSCSDARARLAEGV